MSRRGNSGDGVQARAMQRVGGIEQQAQREASAAFARRVLDQPPQPSPVMSQMANSYTDAMQRMGGHPGNGQPVLFVDPSDHGEPGHDRELMICQVCQTPLNRLTATDNINAPANEIQWLHARNWIDYDHEPVPVLAGPEYTRDTDCDFCGLARQMHWAYKGARMRMGAGNTLNDYGNVWSACADCGPIIDSGDLDALAKRALRVGPRISGFSTWEKETVAENFLGLWEQFLATVTERQYIGPKREPAKLHARMMPKLQSGLLKFWHSEKFQSFGGEALRDFEAHIPGIHAGDEERFWQTYPIGESVPKQVWLNHCNHIAAGVGVADMYWISSNFTRLAIHAGKKFDKIAITREELPPKNPRTPDDDKHATFGFMVFEEPIGEIQRPAGAAAVRACTWTLVPGGVWFNLYIQGEDADADVDVDQMRSEIGYLLCPNAGAGFEFGVDIPLPEDADVGFMTTILATWVLLRQPGVAGFQEAPVDKKYARSYQRENKRALPPVHLVDLRARPRPKAKPQSSTGKQWTERRLVHGHMKRQFYGTGRALRKWIYVDDYIAGPEDAPLRDPRIKVNVLK